jgi:hypothetical protein
MYASLSGINQGASLGRPSGTARKTTRRKNIKPNDKNKTLALELKASHIKNEESSVLSRSDLKFDKEVQYAETEVN